MNPVSLVTIHHEGAGTPSDVPRGAGGGYTYWIGATQFIHLRDVWSSYATLDFNHVSLDICLSGNRMTSPVTDPDIALIHLAVNDARIRGYVVDAPQVRPHRNSPGSSTVCPGDQTMARWGEIVAACLAQVAPAPPLPELGDDDMVVIQPGGTPAGRFKKYKLVPDQKAVLLSNGARLVGDSGPTAIGCWWHVPSNAPVDGIALNPDGSGIVVTATDDGTFAAKFQ